MQAFFEIPGLNVYIQIFVTLISIGVYFRSTRNKIRKDQPLRS